MSSVNDWNMNQTSSVELYWQGQYEEENLPICPPQISHVWYGNEYRPVALTYIHFESLSSKNSHWIF